MKKLQNNFTTPEQSKRLLELGVPAESADCVKHHCYGQVSPAEQLPKNTFFRKDYSIENGMVGNQYGFPCWSVGRLVEICLKCSTLKQRQVRFFCNGDDDEYSLIDYVITALVSGIMTNHMDFSKLED